MNANQMDLTRDEGGEGDTGCLSVWNEAGWLPHLTSDQPPGLLGLGPWSEP